MSIDLEGASCEAEAARLLPWYIAGRLSAADVERVTQHLERCAICRDDVAHEREVRALLKADDRLEYAPQAGLAKTLARIDELGRDSPALAQAPGERLGLPARRPAAVRWLAAAVVVQAIGLGVLGASLLQRSSPDPVSARYETLSSVPPPVAPGLHIRAVFAPTSTLAELRSLLAPASLTIVRGPSEAGAYTLASTDLRFTSHRRDAVVAALRADARVLFIEPVVDGAAGDR